MIALSGENSRGMGVALDSWGSGPERKTFRLSKTGMSFPHSPLPLTPRHSPSRSSFEKGMEGTGSRQEKLEAGGKRYCDSRFPATRLQSSGLKREAREMAALSSLPFAGRGKAGRQGEKKRLRALVAPPGLQKKESEPCAKTPFLPLVLLLKGCLFSRHRS